MIIVTMAKDNRVRRTQVDTKTVGVAAEDVSLPRVEQDSSPPPFDPESEAVLCNQTMTLGRVFDEHC